MIVFVGFFWVGVNGKMKRQILTILITIGLVLTFEPTRAMGVDGGRHSWAKDSHNSRVSDDILTLPFKLKWESDPNITQITGG